MKRVKIECFLGNGMDMFEDELQFPSNTSDDDIEEEVHDYVMQQLEWNWKIIEDDEED